jgi:hypothetical protein
LVSDALDTIIKALVPGNPIKNAYIAGRDFIKGKDASLGGKLFTNFGFGVSLVFEHIFYRLVMELRKTNFLSMRPMRI